MENKSTYALRVRVRYSCRVELLGIPTATSDAEALAIFKTRLTQANSTTWDDTPFEVLAWDTPGQLTPRKVEV